MSRSISDLRRRPGWGDRGEAKTILTVTAVQVEQAAAVDSEQLADGPPAELVNVVQVAWRPSRAVQL